MGRMYSITFTNITVSAAQDLFELLPATQKPVVIHALFLSQNSDVGDAQDEVLRFSIIRGHTTSGSGGASVTPVPLNSADTVSGATCERNNTTIASAGTAVTLHTDGFNVRAGLALIFPPEMRIRVANNNLLVVRIPAPADSIVMDGTLYFEEV